MIQTPEWYNASVLIDRNLEAGRAEKVAIFYGDEEITYGELARRINRFGHALKGLGIGGPGPARPQPHALLSGSILRRNTDRRGPYSREHAAQGR